VLFVPTGTKDSPEYVESATEAFLSAGAGLVVPLLLTRNPSARAVAAAVEAADLVHFGGGSAPAIVKHGNRFALAAQLTAGLERGLVLSGISGGAIALFEGGLGAYNGYRPLPGWGLAPGTVLPHFHPGEEAALEEWLAADRARFVWAVEDGAALVWDGQAARVVSERPDAGVWRLTSAGTQRVE
jgi:peptidase E